MSKNYDTTRGKRNNNPLNIRYNPWNRWQGEDCHDSDGFCRFKSLAYGLRACFALLRNYNLRHGCKTLSQIINRWAPPTENHTDTYIAFICSRTGFDADTVIDYRSEEAITLIKAMAFYESNWDIDRHVIESARRIL